ncbi:MAG: hypothetical protein Satyrvirus15_6 [Satyrvirus sp.]|uniref:Uncharacterized protein n=1 Tax=Satyrvirus sp. TaxID=2487771 RepID=A0A3G5AJ07_9VIRU|nr:MAG: hypothetical protein Satyrvirus15_6 [Satyrvirus sp.]
MDQTTDQNELIHTVLYNEELPTNIQTKCVIAIDASGSTVTSKFRYTELFNAELKICYMMAHEKCPMTNILFWSYDAENYTPFFGENYITKCSQIRNTKNTTIFQGTEPACLFTNNLCRRIMVEAKLVVLLTDGEIQQNDVNKCFEYTRCLHNVFVGIIVLPNENNNKKPADINVSVLMPFAIGNAIIGVIRPSTGIGSIHILYTSGYFQDPLNFGKIVIDNDTTWEQVRNIPTKTLLENPIRVYNEPELFVGDSMETDTDSIFGVSTNKDDTIIDLGNGQMVKVSEILQSEPETIEELEICPKEKILLLCRLYQGSFVDEIMEWYGKIRNKILNKYSTEENGMQTSLHALKNMTKPDSSEKIIDPNDEKMVNFILDIGEELKVYYDQKKHGKLFTVIGMTQIGTATHRISDKHEDNPLNVRESLNSVWDMNIVGDYWKNHYGISIDDLHKTLHKQYQIFQKQQQNSKLKLSEFQSLQKVTIMDYITRKIFGNIECEFQNADNEFKTKLGSVTAQMIRYPELTMRQFYGMWCKYHIFSDPSTHIDAPVAVMLNESGKHAIFPGRTEDLFSFLFKTINKFTFAETLKYAIQLVFAVDLMHQNLVCHGYIELEKLYLDEFENLYLQANLQQNETDKMADIFGMGKVFYELYPRNKMVRFNFYYTKGKILDFGEVQPNNEMLEYQNIVYDCLQKKVCSSQVLGKLTQLANKLGVPIPKKEKSEVMDKQVVIAGQGILGKKRTRSDSTEDSPENSKRQAGMDMVARKIPSMDFMRYFTRSMQ